MPDSIISLHNVSYRYPSGILALDSINLEFPKAKKIALLGSNGAGKSTLMLLLNGVLRPSNGYLKYEADDFSYKKKDLRSLRKKVGYLFQDSDNQLIAPTVYEEVSFGLNNLSTDKEWIRQKVDETIKVFCLKEIINRTPHELSAGQKKRVCLASILAMEPELIVCDEPTSNLDPHYSDLTMNHINELSAAGKTVLIATHDVNMAYEWADFVVLLKEGKVVCKGASRQVFSNQKYIEDSGFKLPLIVETCYAINPNIRNEELPGNMTELKKMINGKL